MTLPLPPDDPRHVKALEAATVGGLISERAVALVLESYFSALQTEGVVLVEEQSRERLAGVFRDWIHEQPFSKCGMGSDTCPDWDMAYELAGLAAGVVVAAPEATGEQRPVAAGKLDINDPAYRHLASQFGLAVAAPPCKACGGTGKLHNPAFPHLKSLMTCPRCNGSGLARMVNLDDVVEFLRTLRGNEWDREAIDFLERRFGSAT